MIDKAITTFEDFIRRYLAPSLSFAIIFVALNLSISLAFGWKMQRPESLLPILCEAQSLLGFSLGKLSFGLLATLGLIGLSHVLATLHQALFDNRSKGDFEPSVFDFISLQSKKKRYLRARVIERLPWEWQRRFRDRGSESLLPELQQDYHLYHLIGNIVPYNTSGYVHLAKSYGIVILSLMLNLLLAGLLYREIHHARTLFPGIRHRPGFGPFPVRRPRLPSLFLLPHHERRTDQSHDRPTHRKIGCSWQ